MSSLYTDDKRWRRRHPGLLLSGLENRQKMEKLRQNMPPRYQSGTLYGSCYTRLISWLAKSNYSNAGRDALHPQHQSFERRSNELFDTSPSSPTSYRPSLKHPSQRRDNCPSSIHLHSAPPCPCKTWSQRAGSRAHTTDT